MRGILLTHTFNVDLYVQLFKTDLPLIGDTACFSNSTHLNKSFIPIPDSCPDKNVNICLEFKITHNSQSSAQPSIHLITLESHNYLGAISVLKLDSRVRKMN